MPLAPVLDASYEQITQHLWIGHVRWADLATRADNGDHPIGPQGCFCDEQVWTFLLACGYAVAGQAGILQLADQLAPGHPELRSPKIWLEARPIPPRYREGTSYIDLAVGDIAGRPETRSGIRLAEGGKWACFTELKWYSDLSLDVVHDVSRNQMARVIENVVCLQGGGEAVRTPFFTLVTPRIFDTRLAGPRSRLYQYKFHEYQGDRHGLLTDINLANPQLPPRNGAYWHYPYDLQQRLEWLQINWVTYDALFMNIPHSPIQPEIHRFWEEHGEYQNRGALA